ncbi:MAG TPA: bifunctional DNA-formamidopyrimidine glycosylase/DNA-(apurinic or apyrimidinic site) lyase [Tepidisphaeraceae bacterium]|jgi:formamidopyrimidine-DNA glycosylase|nr:bifunctional DNA-formamidopyrimidine glycosylase/DNA-(apurinic or apyrimidinic site) lyase [Tepidisphaeraceae bacterium]
MPELPEVQTVVTTLRPRAVGQTINDVLIHRADVITPPEVDLRSKLLGRRIESIDRRGKRIIFTVTTAERFYVHLGMTGRLTIDPPDAPLLKHTHVAFKLPNFDIRFRDPRRFGGLWWLGAAMGDDLMGPEPLDLRPAQLAVQLRKTKRAIKVALLDQRLIAGLGNIYVDEALHASGIHPLLPACEVSPAQVMKLNRAIKTVLRRAIRSRGSSLRDYVDADGNKGDFQRLHRVYDRAGEACQGCRTTIERIVLGGRSTHFCPRCQRSG